MQQNCHPTMRSCLSMFMRIRFRAEFFGRVCPAMSDRESVLRDRRGEIPQGRTLSERPLHIEARRQVESLGMRYCQYGAVLRINVRKCGYAVIAKVSNKTSELVCSAILSKHKPFAIRKKN